VKNKLLLLLAFCLGMARLPAQTLTITHATIVDVSSGKLHPDSTVVIQGNRIASVSSSASPTRSKSQAGQVIDAKGLYLIPGLWDMHTHVYFDSTAADGTDIVLPLFLANGITGRRSLVRQQATSHFDIILK
jgi:adenine deaminase